MPVVEQINQAVDNIDKLTQSNADSARSTTAAGEQFSAQAADPMETVNLMVAVLKGQRGRWERGAEKIGS